MGFSNDDDPYGAMFAAADAEQVSEFRGQAVRATGSTHFPFRLHVVVP